MLVNAFPFDDVWFVQMLLLYVFIFLFLYSFNYINSIFIDYSSIPSWCVLNETIREAVNVRPWWRHQTETFSALLALCAGKSPIPGEIPAQRPGTRNFDVIFDLAWINGWVKICEAGDLGRHHAHYGVIVMLYKYCLYDLHCFLTASVVDIQLLVRLTKATSLGQFLIIQITLGVLSHHDNYDYYWDVYVSWWMQKNIVCCSYDHIEHISQSRIIPELKFTQIC